MDFGQLSSSFRKRGTDSVVQHPGPRQKNIHWETQGHLELATGGTTTVNRALSVENSFPRLIKSSSCEVQIQFNPLVSELCEALKVSAASCSGPRDRSSIVAQFSQDRRFPSCLRRPHSESSTPQSSNWRSKQSLSVRKIEVALTRSWPFWIIERYRRRWIEENGWSWSRCRCRIAGSLDAKGSRIWEGCGREALRKIVSAIVTCDKLEPHQTNSHWLLPTTENTHQVTFTFTNLKERLITSVNYKYENARNHFMAIFRSCVCRRDAHQIATGALDGSQTICATVEAAATRESRLQSLQGQQNLQVGHDRCIARAALRNSIGTPSFVMIDRHRTCVFPCSRRLFEYALPEVFGANVTSCEEVTLHCRGILLEMWKTHHHLQTVSRRLGFSHDTHGTHIIYKSLVVVPRL